MAPAEDKIIVKETDRARYKRMFKEFDINNDGILSVHELTEALKVVGASQGSESLDTERAKVC